VQPFNEVDYAEQVERLTRAGQKALTQYGLKNAQLELAAYVNNAVFKVINGAGYALRLHRPDHKRPEWIRSELIWLESIRQHTALQVPQPVRTLQGELLTHVPVEGLSDPVTAVIFGWIEGTFYGNDTIPLEAVRQAGRFLAQLHEYAARFAPPPDFARPHLDWEGLFEERSAYNPGEGARIFTDEQNVVFAAVEQQVRAVMETIGQESQTFGLIHADFIAKNWLFNGKGLCAIDFDDCSWGYYLYDIAPALLQFKYEPRYRALREAFLAGYGAIRPLSTADETALETFIAARHLASCRWLAGNLHNPRIRERAADLIAQRTGELRRFLETGSLDEGGRKEFF
jgi:Ser/Thr protein kinase RdoA (MazF antagonist)